MKGKFFIIIVLIMILLTSTITVVGKLSWTANRANRNNRRENIDEFLFEVLLRIASRLYEKNGWVPQGLLERLESFDIR